MTQQIELSNTLAPDELSSASTEALREQLGMALTLTAQALRYAGALWAELERRGEDLSDLKRGLALYLPLIASGQLLADIVVRYAGRRMLILSLSRLALEQQREVLESGTLPVACVEGRIVRQIESFAVEQLTSRDLRFVFTENGVRPLLEQSKLRYKSLSRPTRPKRRSKTHVEVTEKGEIEINGYPMPVKTVMKALSNHYGFDVELILNRERSTRKALFDVGKQKM